MMVLTTPRGLADVNVSVNHVDGYYCIKSSCHLKTLEKIVFVLLKWLAKA